MSAPLELGFSPCPNDTFMFWAWVHGELAGAPAVAPWLADIEALNQRALGPDPLPITKLSVAAFAHVGDRYRISTAGAALGRGCGPLVVVRDGASWRGLGELAGRRVAIPGARTTAALLIRAFAPEFEAVTMRFDEIMHRVADGSVDAGVIIHESRFTYPAFGLRELADLGALWEQDTGLPIPLGAIGVRRDVADAAAVTAAIRSSVERARTDPAATHDYVARHAQELAPDVCARHIELYVNDASVDVGADGRRAVAELLRRAGAGAVTVEWV